MKILFEIDVNLSIRLLYHNCEFEAFNLKILNGKKKKFKMSFISCLEVVI